MAGGIGSRFWPMSRTNFPKQFLDILNTGKTLIQATYDRFASFIPAENIFVVYNFDEETWVNFKLFGMLGLTLLTAIGQALWIAAKTSGRPPQGQEES